MHHIRTYSYIFVHIHTYSYISEQGQQHGSVGTFDKGKDRGKGKGKGRKARQKRGEEDRATRARIRKGIRRADSAEGSTFEVVGTCLRVVLIYNVRCMM